MRRRRTVAQVNWLKPQDYRGESGSRPREASTFPCRRMPQRAPRIAPICIATKIAATPCHGALNSSSMQRHTVATTICVGIKVLRYCTHMSGLPKKISIGSFYKDIRLVPRASDAEISIEQRFDDIAPGERAAVENLDLKPTQ